MNPTSNPPQPAKPAPPKLSPGGPPPPLAEPESSASRGWLLPLLAVLFVIGVCVVVGLAIARHPGKQTADQPELSPAPPVESVSAPAPNPPPVSAAAVSNAAPVPRSPALKLQGIVYNSTRPWAIVNGKTVYAGDRVGNFHVKEILQNSVTLENTNGSLKTLFLGK